MTPFSGAVLAGGRSSRFGSDKAAFVYRSRPLLRWVLDSLAAADDQFIIANRDYSGFGVPVHGDLQPGGGSLSGLHAALVHARHDWLALAACDLPFLTDRYWQLLLEQRTLSPAVVVGDEEALEPLAALYHRSLLPLVETQLSRGEYAMHQLIRQADACIIPRHKVLKLLGPDLFRNINYLADLPALSEPDGL